MKTLNNIISENLILHRKNNSLTQSDVAELLNYSDKSISKWEQGHSIPTLEILLELTNIYKVSLDDLVTDKDILKIDERKEYEKLVNRQYSRLIVSLLSISVVWIIATIIYSVLTMVGLSNGNLAYLWSVPITALMTYVFNFLWGKRSLSVFILSTFMWLTLAALYITLYSIRPMIQIFYSGFPIQVAIILTKYISKTIITNNKKRTIDDK